MTKDEALKLALEALHYCEALSRPVHEQKIHAIKAIKQALAQPEERNFCPRCGKRTADPTTIHTCTSPQEKDV